MTKVQLKEGLFEKIAMTNLIGYVDAIEHVAKEKGIDLTYQEELRSLVMLVNQRG